MTKLSLLFFLLFIFITEMLPQERIAFKKLTVENGLSQSSVTCILQDRNGFIWLGTQDGLNRYDGYKLKIFKNISSDSTSLSENFIFSIYQDDQGVLYIETQSGKFHKYNPRRESFQLVEKEKLNLTGAKVSTVGARLLEPSGILWTGGLGSGTGLTRRDTKTGKVTVFKHVPSDPSSLSDDKVYSIFRDRSGNLWIGTFNGLDRLDELSGKFFHYRHNPSNENSLPGNWIWPIYEDSKGNLIIGTVKGGLSIFNPKNNTFKNYKNDPGDPSSINDNFIFSITEDKSGMIWIGTNLGGVNYFYPSADAFDHFYNDPKEKNSLSDNNVASMMADRSGNYWIGTGNGGLNRFEYGKKRFTQFTHNPGNSNSLLSNSVQSLFEDRNGIIWIGTFSSGLSSYNPKANKFTHYTHNPKDSVSLTDNRVYSIAEDSEGNLWIGTYGGGINKLDKKSNKFSSYKSAANDSNSLSSNATWSMAFDNSNNLWVGTFGGGVNLLEVKSKAFKHYKNSPDNSESIIDNNIIRVFRDSKGTMWFGTTKGLSKYIEGTNSFKNYTEKEGLANNFVYGIVEDSEGNIWLSTNKGLSKFNPTGEIFTNFYTEDGLQSNEFNQNAYAKDNLTGNILFGGPNGFNVFNPQNLKGNRYIPPIQFTGFFRYNSDDEEGKPIYEKGISERDSVFVTYKDNIITFEFAALSYYNNHKNQYKYRLEGINENWIQLGNQHSVTFTNLPQGDYTLHVVGSNNDGLWNEDGEKLFIHVSPPWWKTDIAYATYFLVFFGFLFGARRFELNRREQKAQIRESELRVKATEAENRALEIENERKTKELEEARQLQLSMLPKELPKLPHLEIGAFMRTATEVGGDYYDFSIQENNVLNVAFGDATGHGLQAGTMVTLMKGFFTSDSSKLGINEFMNHCSKMIKEIRLGRILMSFSFIKIYEKKLSVSSAGMPPIYFYNKKAEVIEEIIMKGMPLGAMAKFPYNIYDKELNSGDTILLISDGLPEQMNAENEMYDYPRLKDQFMKLAENSPEEIIERLIISCDKWMEGTSQADDISIMVIKVK
jgi:ligand-binding sensor domain-containing protein/serine phosphatase RsbU (regulator of sigma subunit)